MDKEKTKDLIKIMQAFLEGEVVECRSLTQSSGWFTHSGDEWNTFKFEYRIQPKPQYRPFKDVDECWKEMKNHQPFGWLIVNDNYENIIELNKRELNKGDNVYVDSMYYDWPYACENITFADGTPFGMKVTDNCPMLRKAPK